MEHCVLFFCGNLLRYVIINYVHLLILKLGKIWIVCCTWNLQNEIQLSCIEVSIRNMLFSAQKCETNKLIFIWIPQFFVRQLSTNHRSHSHKYIICSEFFSGLHWNRIYAFKSLVIQLFYICVCWRNFIRNKMNLLLKSFYVWHSSESHLTIHKRTLK